MNQILRVVMTVWGPFAFYCLVGLFLLLPLLTPGFILTLDMVFTPTLPMPESVTSSYLFHAGLHYLNLFIPGDILQKIVLFVILAFSGLGMHRLMRALPPSTTSAKQWAAYASGLLYMINPFVYSRFMAGQYAVLLGYACLPFFVTSLLKFLKEPTFKSSIILASWVVGISIVSIHTIGLALIITFVALPMAMWGLRTDRAHLKQLAKYILMVGCIFALASSYWLLPLLLGNGPTATSIDAFRTSDQSAFATEGNGVAGKLMHEVRLQGFWGERQDLFLLPQDILRMWGVFVIAVWALVTTGAIAAWRKDRRITLLFIISMGISAFLAAGVGTAWLANNVPFFAGYREPQKFVAIIALGYAVFVGFAVQKIINAVQSKVGSVGFSVGFLIILIGFTPVMFHGFVGQLVPRKYPADWYTINMQLNKDEAAFQVLSLPWHLYMRYQFTDRLIANPTDKFFDKPFIVSDDPEFGTVKPAVFSSQKYLLSERILPKASRSNDMGSKLAPLSVKYVLLSKENDYKTYSYLDKQADLQLITETATLKLYRNTSFAEGAR